MEFQKVLGIRRSIRYFEPDKPVEQEKIQKVLEAMRIASCAVNAHWLKAVVVKRHDIAPDDLEKMKNPVQANVIALAPVHIYLYGDPGVVNRYKGARLKQLDDLPTDAEMIRTALLDAFDRQRQVDLVARLVARHLSLGHSPQALIATLARALLREDAGFHAYQMLEAGVRQSAAWGDTDEGRHILIAVARYLAAHSPTERAALQTADIARRLMRGGELHQEAGAS